MPRKPVKIIGVGEETYARLEEIKAMLSARTGRRVSFNEVIQALIAKVERCRRLEQTCFEKSQEVEELLRWL